MNKTTKITRERFSFYAKPLFRTCEIVCNHAARVLMKKSALAQPDVLSRISDLNSRRIEHQGVLNGLLGSHGQVCADCAGHCCGGVRERDAFIDRVLQLPSTPHIRGRRKSGEMAAYAVAEAQGQPIHTAEGAESVPGHCPELTTKGCRIPYELRPIQCTAYFCRQTVKELSPDDCARGINALKGLMGVQLGTVALALKTRLGKP